MTRRLIILIASAALVAMACIPRETSQIALTEEQTISMSGPTWELDYYVNDAYQCGLSGDYSFMVMNPANDPTPRRRCGCTSTVAGPATTTTPAPTWP